jgi:hypothetical protein
MRKRARQNGEVDDSRRVVVLEVVAASAILSIIVLVLVLVFTYRPA